MFGFILRITKSFSETNAVNLYFSFVCNKLDYASVVWSPLHITDIFQLERVQKGFLKYLSSKLDINYPGRNYETLVKIHNFVDLSTRRKK